MLKNWYNITKRIRSFQKNVLHDNHIVLPIVAAIIFVGLQLFIVSRYVPELPLRIPFFFIFPWGEQQLAPRESLWVIALFGIAVIAVHIFLIIKEQLRSRFFLAHLYSYFALVCESLLTAYIIRLISILSLEPFDLPPVIKLMGIPTVLAFITTFLATPLVITFAKKFGFVDDPLTHKHPAMLITKPIPRAGGLAFFIGIFIPALIIIPITTSQKMIGILLGSLIMMLTGLWDDKKDPSPFIRFFIQGIAILITVFSGIILVYIPNPFGMAIKLDYFKIVFDFFGTHQIYYFGVLAAAFWMWWTMNFMSWANGTDGVYAGLVSIAAIVIAGLMLRDVASDPSMGPFIKLSSLVAGSALAMAFFTWPPHKLMWGFGATSAGLIIASLSILGSTKVATTLIVLIIPFMDGIFAFFRRLKRGQFPFWGDREHFHHKLLFELHWSKSQIALFYWSTTILFAIIGILTSGKTRALSLLSVGIVVVIIIALFNLKRASSSQKP